MKIIKKILAIVMATFMILPMIPLAATAEGVEEEHEYDCFYLINSDTLEFELKTKVDTENEGAPYGLNATYCEITNYHVYSTDESVLTVAGVSYVENYHVTIEGYEDYFYDINIKYHAKKAGTADLIIVIDYDSYECILVNGEWIRNKIISHEQENISVHVTVEGIEGVIRNYDGEDITDEDETFEHTKGDINLWYFGIEENEGGGKITNLTASVTSSNPAAVNVLLTSPVTRVGNNDYSVLAYFCKDSGEAELTVKLSGTDSEGKAWNFEKKKKVKVSPKINEDPHPLPAENFAFFMIKYMLAEEDFQKGDLSFINYIIETNPLFYIAENILKSVNAKDLMNAALFTAVPVAGLGRTLLSRLAFAVVRCPVDVRVLNSNGDLLTAIKTGDTDIITVNGLVAWADGDEKFFLVPKNRMSEFQFQLEAVGDGKMTLINFYTDSDLNVENPAAFSDVPLNKGDLFNFVLDYGNNTRLFLMENDNPASEIKADGTQSDSEQTGPESAPPQNSDGENNSEPESINPIILVGGGFVLVCIIIVLVFFIVNKKRKKNKK